MAHGITGLRPYGQGLCGLRTIVAHNNEELSITIDTMDKACAHALSILDPIAHARSYCSP